MDPERGGPTAAQPVQGSEGGGGTTRGGRKRVEKGRKAENWVSPLWRFLQLAAACAAFAIILRANQVRLEIAS